ncbi:UDP-N-acetylmuramoylalanyl-D-glutamate--2,6-diaminopimelate ligase [Natronincola peptidivorans]|uniref:UDP-N-acetylmuramoyl-L-alanyl-D-glutamate--2,6-diaminopimelate ligase n=1 Tax=Natronincola peptidivorans TaxID=426128 RepID=A0A1H9Y856_9FIRM|nr:UDP-N-acetylmuramoyl-L-alanyl-D-glutamate--2,6-diaminopimelate ligase [Natronincola peptidivorans]SES64562.1 UDP-N-acetylmuramoylalanyl-D-glutamate--2,6-diaminopimelate ligase [Natronincola peptidivorans]
MLLKDLLRGLKVKEIQGNDKLFIKDIAYNSQKSSDDSLFICIEGLKTDGHLYIKDAIRRGAIAVIVQKDVKVEGATIVQVEDTRKALALIANRYHHQPSTKLNLIGVTGTNGKTSTTYMIKKILEINEKKIGLIGTISNWLGNEKEEDDRTTPEALDLQRLLHRMVKKKIKSCVMEVSSHSLELQRVEECNFTIGVFTNLTPDHLDFHETIENYRNAKKKLFYKTSFYNIINIDDNDGKIILDEIKHLDTPILTYGVNSEADISAKNIVMTIKSVSFDLMTPSYEEKIKINIPGMFTVYNALAAITTAYCMRIDREQIKLGLQSIKGIAGRIEPIEEFKEFAVIVDYAHTPDALENILKSVKGFVNNKLITVFGCGGDRDRSKRPVMGEISSKFSDVTIITSDNPRSEKPTEIIDMIVEGIRGNKEKYHIVVDRREAIRKALKSAVKGDIILIVGKGHETYQIINENVIEFDDKKVAIEVAREEGIL